MKIAIDGPAGAGKSVISKLLAEELGFLHVDTGALYRAVGLSFLRQGVEDEAQAEQALQDLSVTLRFVDGEQRVLVNGEDITSQLREERVSMAASKAASLPVVRRFLFQLQRDIAQQQDCVMDGRDIGTVVLPDAEVKIFLTASPGERAKRRVAQLREKGQQADYRQILADINRRDEQDQTRAISPLKAAQDAVVVDTSENTIPQVMERLKGIVEERRSR